MYEEGACNAPLSYLERYQRSVRERALGQHGFSE